MVDEKQPQPGLIGIFKDFLSGQAQSIASIENFGKSFETTAVSWQFELPDLYQFCCQQRQELSDQDYLQFRQNLYRYPTNQMIATSGGQFKLIEDRGHIDRNLYALIRVGQTG